MAKAQAADAVLFGAVGGPKWDKVPYADPPGGRAAAPAQGSRPLRQSAPGDLLSGAGRRLLAQARGGRGARHHDRARADRRRLFRRAEGDRRRWRTAQKRAVDTQVYTTHEIERIARVAFDLARKRRNKVHSAEKRNVMKIGRAVERGGRQGASQTATADVELEHILADNCAMQLVRDAEAVRRDRHRQSVRRRPVGRGGDADGLARHAAVGIARRRRSRRPAGARRSTSRCTARRPTSPARASPTRSPRSPRFAMALRYSFDLRARPTCSTRRSPPRSPRGIRTGDIMQPGMKRGRHPRDGRCHSRRKLLRRAGWDVGAQ